MLWNLYIIYTAFTTIQIGTNNKAVGFSVVKFGTILLKALTVIFLSLIKCTGVTIYFMYYLTEMMYQFEQNLMEQELSYYMFYYIQNLLANIFLRLGMVNSSYLNDICTFTHLRCFQHHQTKINLSQYPHRHVQQRFKNGPTTVQRPSNDRPTTLQRPSNDPQQQNNKKQELNVYSVVSLFIHDSDFISTASCE